MGSHAKLDVLLSSEGVIFLRIKENNKEDVLIQLLFDQAVLIRDILSKTILEAEKY